MSAAFGPNVVSVSRETEKPSPPLDPLQTIQWSCVPTEDSAQCVLTNLGTRTLRACFQTFLQSGPRSEPLAILCTGPLEPKSTLFLAAPIPKAVSLNLCSPTFGDFPDLAKCFVTLADVLPLPF